jgi:UDP:flavonoid glycosyltransferase YjiC (YdhE family)
LIAPLDWGLGHATRCIPVINSLIRSGAEVILAAEGMCASLLTEEFPQITILNLRGYRIRYPKKARNFLLKFLIQIPRIISTIYREHQWLKKDVSTHKIDAVISDNRFGLFHAKIPCAYITHQLFIETGYALLNPIAQRINYFFIGKFDECWIPDLHGEKNLGGRLSHPSKLPHTRIEYLGVLSRFNKISSLQKNKLLIILSGPEPQRSSFESKLISQLNDKNGKVVLLRGLPGMTQQVNHNISNLTVYNHLPAVRLNILIQESDIIIARSGYSTVMDLFALGKKAILVPTPCQSEQEYLATCLREKKLFYSTREENFQLERSIRELSTFEYSDQLDSIGINESIITAWHRRLGHSRQL